jgi:hypothetical protein
MANPFAILAEEQSIERPNTPTNSSTTLQVSLSPRKKARTSKRQAMSPPPKEGPEKAQKTATEYLYLAKEAISAAIEAEKLALEEKYIEDNNI